MGHTQGLAPHQMVSAGLMAVFIGVVGMDSRAAELAPANRRVLTLDQDEWGRPFYLAAYAALRQKMVEELQGKVVFCSESMDLARFNRPGYLADLRGWIKQKYQGFRPVVILVAGEECLNFAVSLRSELWPEAAIVFGAIPEEVLAGK